VNHGVTVPVQAEWDVLVSSDLHFLSEDKRFIDILVDFARDVKPHINLLNGDIHDCNALSKHPKEARQQVDDGALQDEAEASQQFFAAMKSATRLGGRCIYGAGNHEGRWDRFVNDNPGLYGIDWWTPYRHSVEGWELYSDGYEFYVGGLTICHGNTLEGSISKHPCSKVAEAHPRENILFGHCHRIDRFTATNWSGGRAHEHGVWTTGHGQDIAQVEYKKRTKWRLGFALVHYWKNGRDLGFTVEQHEVFRTGKRLVMYSPVTNRMYHG
jgi:hypothetical protein